MWSIQQIISRVGTRQNGPSLQRRLIGAASLVALLLLIPSLQANPGGEGDATRDFTCGGSCHGDPSLSVPSSAMITISSDRNETYSGGPLAVTATVTGMELGAQRIVGVFLLSSLNGVDDSPSDTGWTILADGSGGSGNYVEHRVFTAEEGVEVTWTLRAPSSEGEHQLHIAVHHGGNNKAHLGQSLSPLNITVGPIPENLPQISDSWEPVSVRGLGVETELVLPIVNATDVTVEWRLQGGQTQSVVATSGPDGTDSGGTGSGEVVLWSVTLPAALGASSIDYRLVMVNDDFTEATPWMELVAEEPTFMPNILAVRLQALALIFATTALIIALTRRLSNGASPTSKNRTADSMPMLGVAATGFGTAAAPPAGMMAGATAPALGGLMAAPPPIMAQPIQPAILAMDDPRRPVGWSDEQWRHYGAGHIEKMDGGQ
jgi:hypothetical protein